MEIKVVEKTKNRLKIELIGKTHTLSNALSKELWNDKDIAIAGYTLSHPMTQKPVLVVETNSGDPQKALLAAVDRLKKKNKEFLGKLKVLKAK